MNVLVLGATGKTGSLVVERALQHGHDVTVLVRDAGRFKISGVRVVTGDSTRPDDVRKAMQGQQAAIDTIGGSTPYKTTQLERTSVQNLITAMKAEGSRRLIAVSMMGLGESLGQAPFWYRYLLMPTFLRGSTQDKAAMEERIKASGLDFVIVRPPILGDTPPTGHVTVLDTGKTGHKITRADLAKFLVDQLTFDGHLRSAVTVVNS